MDGLKLHLLINYYPAIGFIIAAMVFVAGTRYRSDRWQRFALKLAVFFALVTLAVVLTGEVASHSGESHATARSEALAGHRLLANVAFVAVMAAGLTAVMGLILGRRDPERGKSVYAIFLILTVISSVLLVTAIVRGRHVKWAAAIPDLSPAVLRSIETEKKLWHA